MQGRDIGQTYLEAWNMDFPAVRQGDSAQAPTTHLLGRTSVIEPKSAFLWSDHSCTLLQVNWHPPVEVDENPDEPGTESWSSLDVPVLELRTFRLDSPQDFEADEDNNRLRKRVIRMPPPRPRPVEERADNGEEDGGITVPDVVDLHCVEDIVVEPGYGIIYVMQDNGKLHALYYA